jgi:hypothetical protein
VNAHHGLEEMEVCHLSGAVAAAVEWQDPIEG